jgi:hypothetical protein
MNVPDRAPPEFADAWNVKVAAPEPATLSFFNDQTGAPLSLPLTFPQGNIADTTAPSVTQPIVA